MTKLLLTALVSCVLSAALGFALLPLLRALKAGQSVRDIGPTWHNNKVGTPLMGGLLFIIALILVLLMNLPAMEDKTALLLLIPACSFGLVGFLDDFCKVKFKRDLGLTAVQKSLLQMAVAAIYLYALYRQGVLSFDLYIPFVNKTLYMNPVVYFAFAMFVMVGCVNAVNLTDGVDGLCSSVTIPVMVFFALYAYKSGKADMALVPASLAGGLVGYLFHNWHPAKVFMGDTGSLFLGGMVCALAFAMDMPLVLIFAGFVYICETLSDIIQVAYFKATHGKRVFKMAPIHHHFEMCGWKEEKIVLVFTAVSALMCVAAWVSVRGRL